LTYVSMSNLVGNKSLQEVNTAFLMTNNINSVSTTSTKLVLPEEIYCSIVITSRVLRTDQGLGSTSGIRACALRNFDLEVMEFESAQSNTTTKLLILKLENGNSWVFVPQTSQENGTSVTNMSIPVTAEEKTNKKNDVKARSLLLMALPNEHQLTFSQFTDAKTMLQKIVSRLAILDIETMSINDLYNNFKIVEQDVKKSVGASTGTQNMAFMTAPSTSNTNNLNTANSACEVGTGSSKVNTGSSSISTANIGDNDVYAFMVENPNSSNLLQQDLEQIHEDDLEVMDLKLQLSLLSMKAKRYYQRTKKKIFINANDTARFDKSKVECFNCHKMGHFARECRSPRNKKGRFRYQDNTRKQGNNEYTSSNAMLAIDGVGFDWSDMAKEQVQTNMALMAFLDSENEVLFSEEVAVLKREVACKDYEIGVLKTEFEKVKQEKDGIDFKIAKFNNASKDLDNLLASQITDKSKKGLGYHVVALPHPLSLNAPTKLDLSYSGLDEFKEPEFNGYGHRDTVLKSTIDCDSESDNSKENTDESLVREQVSEDENSSVESPLNVDKETIFHAAKKVEFVKPKNNEKPVRKSVRVDYDYYAKTSYPTTHMNMTPRAVLLKSGLKPLSTARPVNTVRPKVVNIARPYIVPVNTVRTKRVNAVKPSSCWVWRPTRPNGASLVFNIYNYIDAQGRSKSVMAWISKSLMEVMLHLEEEHMVVEFLVKMCDKKNYVLFNDSECLVLSPNFKLPDESQILLKIPRKGNMYSFDVKNIVPKENLTCLVAKATLDESILWHRRLGHINFKNMNKLVKENLVRGLPLKHFENDQTCVACLKGKQHRASCKSKVLNPITKPLFMLHMDLFGPTFVSSLMHKRYCLVVTDDYSMFTWVFFLTTKDETSEILKNFIKEIENLVDNNVKIIRCDNGTEFKNKVMDDFFREKGIRREYSIARTPQQNRVAERRNRTLIEAARTMVFIVKPHNKTPYELFRGFKPTLSFMKPFGCHVTILNTLESLGKFDGKSDEGFFVGYSLSSKAFRVYNTRTRKVEENLHVRFLENKPMIEGNGTQGDLNADASYFDSPSKELDDDDEPKQVEDGPNNESDDKDKSKDDSSPEEVNVARQHINTASPMINTGSLELTTVVILVNNASSKDMLGAADSLEATHIEFFSDEDEPKVDLGNIPNSYPVPTTPNYRIHKDHPIKNVIGDVKSSV
ncbi:putative ribonuclease H-like domain-containing protein, partial [Tanacetum coccineum]